MARAGGREANAAYMREYRRRRASDPELRQARTYRKALAELRERHREEFDAIYHALLQSDGQGGSE